LEIGELNETVVNETNNILNPSYQDYVNSDQNAREKALQLLRK